MQTQVTSSQEPHLLPDPSDPFYKADELFHRLKSRAEQPSCPDLTHAVPSVPFSHFNSTLDTSAPNRPPLQSHRLLQTKTRQISNKTPQKRLNISQGPLKQGNTITNVFPKLKDEDKQPQAIIKLKQKQARQQERIADRHKSIQEEMLRIDRDDMFQLDSQNENQVTEYIQRLIRQSEEDDPQMVLHRVRGECKGTPAQLDNIRNKLKKVKSLSRSQAPSQHYNQWFVGPGDRFRTRRPPDKYLFAHQEDFYQHLYHYSLKDQPQETNTGKTTRLQQEKHLGAIFSKLEHTAFVANYLEHLKKKQLRPSQIFNTQFRQSFRLGQQQNKQRHRV